MRSLQSTVGNAAVSRLLARSARSHRALLQRRRIETTDEAMGQQVVDKLDEVNAGATATSGVHYPDNYRDLAMTDPDAKAFWKEDYWSGYADPKFFTRTATFSWELSASMRAAPAIKAWLKGPTIADCASVLVAVELDTLRAAVGDKRFDELFSGSPPQPAEKGPLRVTQDQTTSSLQGFMTETDAASDPDGAGRQAVKKGEFYYFGNHPMYAVKHPAGMWKGENAVCVDAAPGAQKYSGFGVPAASESEMLDLMVPAYNAPRDERDYEKIVTSFAAAAARRKTADQTWEEVYRAVEDDIPDAYRTTGFPDSVDADAIVKAPPIRIDGVLMEGGLLVSSGLKLDAAAIAQAR